MFVFRTKKALSMFVFRTKKDFNIFTFRTKVMCYSLKYNKMYLLLHINKSM